jgi:hypothetical protein
MEDKELNKTRLEQIEVRLGLLSLGNDDVRIELLRERNLLRNGTLNKTDQQLLKDWYSGRGQILLVSENGFSISMSDD